jgi:hypothetical protein
LGFACPFETFFGHCPIFGGRLHGKMCPSADLLHVSLSLSALSPTQRRNYEQSATPIGDVAHDNAGVQFLDNPGRREAAGSQQ